ncbi:transcriptional regulator [Natrarchaeobius halalkaliphilus]|uniref:Transcriptional regulator n=1 Tax=Natrarchaeobius halalkaliphilus TaxID=1679091 RepID=A0A3N6LSJ4_9EURY|nr:Rrf2 family transcriptional regulator [Natrarchaeobius halalkaliphilus]RQG92918.1 transcriptional regulator [Natrarchaeobius halalkaliphilus]
MVDPRSPDPYDDINEAVRSEWEAETTPAERVKNVIRHTYTPVTAGAVADDAQTTPKTARKHLEALAEDGFVTTTQGKRGATLYRRSNESLVTERANRLLSERSVEELTTRVAELQEEIQEYRETHGVDSPEELVVRLGNEALDNSDSDTRVDRSVVTEWQTTRRNLAFATAAVSIGKATDYIAESRSNSTQAVNSH